jgi:micrococcal nuclease
MKKLLLATLLGSTLFASVQYGTVTKVVDGDTIYFKSNGEEVKCRVANIDTPESRRNSKAKRDASKCNAVTVDTIVKAGKKSTEYAKDYFKLGSKHKFEISGYDRYKRAICTIGGYNLDIVKDGYAVPYWRYIDSSLKRDYQKAIREAKSGNKGLWRSDRSVMNCMGFSY